MLPLTHQLVHGAQSRQQPGTAAVGGSRLPLWCAGGSPVHISRSRAAPAAASSDVAPVDLVRWPEGTRPKRGAVTKAALARLKVTELRAELARLGADSSGNKDQLADKLLQLITAAPGPAGSDAAQPAAAQQRPAAARQAADAAASSQQTPAAAAAAPAPAARQRPPRAASAAAAADAAVQQLAAAGALANHNGGSAAAAAAAEQLDAASAQLAAAAAEAIRKLQAKQQQQQSQEEAAAASRRAPANGTSHSSSSSSSNGGSSSSHARASGTPATNATSAVAADSPVQPGCMPPLDPQEAARVAAAVGVSLDELPPLASQARGHVYDVADMPGLTEEEQEIVLKACRTGLVLTLLGGDAGDIAAGEGAPPCVGLLRERDIWLWDAGEDLQRALMWREHLKPSKMHRVVVTRQSPDAMLGLPGVLCVIGAAREKGHESADIPVHVFGPEGTADFLSTMYTCSDTFLEMPVVVHEFVMRAVPDELQQPQPLNMRAKLWRVLMPPDQLNPAGWVDGDLEGFMPIQGRARVKKGLRAAGGVLAKNPRGGYRPFSLPPPGDPSRTDLQPQDMTWTVRADEAALMKAVLLDAPAPTWGVVWQEADRQGNLSLPRCTALGVNDSSSYRHIKNGEAVPNDQGVLIPAPLLCSPDKPGRKVVLLPPCNSADNLARHAASADVMFGAAGAAAAGQQLGVGLGRAAQEWGVRHLVVTGMPGKPASSGIDGGSSRRRQQGGGSASSSQDEESGGQPARAALSEQAAAVLSVVSEQFTAGAVVAGRDDLSLMVEENLGAAAPPAADLAAKAADARATCLAMLPEEVRARQAAEMRQQRQKSQHVRPQREQQQRQWRPSARGDGGGGRQQAAGGWQQGRQGRQPVH